MGRMSLLGRGMSWSRRNLPSQLLPLRIPAYLEYFFFGKNFAMAEAI